MDHTFHQQEYTHKGYTVIENVYTPDEVAGIIQVIQSADTANPTFRKTGELFAIRQFLKEIPALKPLLMNNKIETIIQHLFGNGYFPVKAIYFDKPPGSNWFVAYHQDPTISVVERGEVPGYGPWTAKHNQFAVQPPLDILSSNFTVRVHLDDTDESNGALKVIPGSHKKGIYRPETINWHEETEDACCVRKGGVMIMSPLLLHASGRTLNGRRRRVAHIEFSRHHLPEPLQWAEA